MHMKQMVSLILVIGLILSLFAGCGSTPKEEKTEEPTVEATIQPVETAEPTTESTTEPTLSPEEVFYNSLPDRMRQAVDAGLVALSQLEDLNRVVTVGEASAMLQKAYIHRTGAESRALNELMSTAEYASLTADRGWILTIPGITDLELTRGDQYENYMQWHQFLNEMHTEELWYGFDDRLGIETFGFGESVKVDILFYSTPQASDKDAYFGMMDETSLYGPKAPSYYDDIYGYALKAYDSTTGKKFFELEDGCINPTMALTVADAAEYALKFYHYPNPMAYPEFVAPEDVGKYNENIITADLLTKKTNLPEASCTFLPANWHGVVMKDMGYQMRTTHLDDQIYEYEIQAIKEAGFNFIGLELDFSWLQETILQDKEFDQYHGFVSSEDVGKFSLSRLEQLDQVIALCMKYDIHVNLRCVSLGDWATNNRPYNQLSNSSTGPKLAAWWQAIARRYADIPNEYLSFMPYTSPAGGANPTAEVLLPSVDAIREVSPDRCIIADVFGWSMKKTDAEAFAEAGVALSSRIGTDENLKMFYHREFFSHRWLEGIKAAGETFIKGFQWPCEGVDARILLASTKKDRVYETMGVAEEYGVGFMVSDFGIIADPYEVYRSPVAVFYPTYRYPDEGYRSMIEDITSAITEKGYGWCFANWFGYFGIADSAPVYDNVTYEQVGDYPYYIDTAMRSWFQEINGVK